MEWKIDIKPVELVDNTFLLTIFLKYHQTMNLSEISRKNSERSLQKQSSVVYKKNNK